MTFRFGESVASVESRPEGAIATPRSGKKIPADTVMVASVAAEAKPPTGVRLVQATGEAGVVAFSPDGTTLAAGDSAGTSACGMWRLADALLRWPSHS